MGCAPSRESDAEAVAPASISDGVEQRRSVEVEAEEGVLGVSSSAAVYPANVQCEDRVVLLHKEDPSPHMFAAVIDGHGGAEAAEFVAERLYAVFARSLGSSGLGGAEGALRTALPLLDDEWFVHVERKRLPVLTKTHCGACVAACVLDLRARVLTVAHVGDSRVVVTGVHKDGTVYGRSLTSDHNARLAAERRRLQSFFPNDQKLFDVSGGAVRVKGVVQVTRSIGDGVLKHRELCAMFNETTSRMVLPPPEDTPYVFNVPDVSSHQLKATDHRIILGTDGVWDMVGHTTCALRMHVQDLFNLRDVSPAEHLVTYTLETCANCYQGRAPRLVERDRSPGNACPPSTVNDLAAVPFNHLSGLVRRDLHDDVSVVALELRWPGGATAPTRLAPGLRAIKDAGVEPKCSRRWRRARAVAAFECARRHAILQTWWAAADELLKGSQQQTLN
mmetsp:Transcript_14909/g.48854  ORF Transcript_14909/g.48854 Transcript_14909/m.48854 type:complete len:448 (-) Transcript_14909:58-1401(-)